MEIKLRGLKQGEHTFVVSEPSKNYDLDAEQFPENLSSEIVIDVQGRNYYISIKTVTDARFTCDRCLEIFNQSYTVKTKLVYNENPALDPEHLQENLFLLPAGSDTVDLTDDVRQNIILNLSMKVVCKESCKGFCNNCGANLNVETCKCTATTTDSRWDALKKLQIE